MKRMTSRERFTRMFEHREADRIPIQVGPWKTTIERWRREGMPEDADVADYFDLDHVTNIESSIRYRMMTTFFHHMPLSFLRKIGEVTYRHLA